MGWRRSGECLWFDVPTGISASMNATESKDPILCGRRNHPKTLNAIAFLRIALQPARHLKQCHLCSVWGFYAWGTGYDKRGSGDRGAHLPFLAFENISIPDETKIFADINSKQKSVSKKLLDEITGEIKLDSADKREQLRAIASRAFDLMRDDEDGPFGDKVAGAEIKRGDGSILTIPYLVDSTLQSGLLGKIVTASGSTTYVQGPLLWEDPREAITALSELLTEYFDLFRTANSHRWNAAKAGKFATNVGVAALIRLLGDVIAFMSAKDHEDPRELHPG
jgi:hypothetical protein